MGTNYYLYEKPACECCKRDFEARHIGKSSFGWCFSLHVDPEDCINDLKDWAYLWNKPGAVIKNEYGEIVSAEEMLATITERYGMVSERDDFDYERNQAVQGPNGLVRHAIDGRHCIGHGAGTWDLMIGDFS